MLQATQSSSGQKYIYFLLKMNYHEKPTSVWIVDKFVGPEELAMSERFALTGCQQSLQISGVLFLCVIEFY